MIITYYGKQFFKAQLGDTVIAYNPISKNSSLEGSRFGADIAIVSMNHPDFNGTGSVSHSSKEPFVVDGPGEYEINGIPIRGYLTESQYEKEKKINTVYLVELENMHLCFLGGVSGIELPGKIMEALDSIDILFIPIGGGDVLSPSDAHKLSNKLEAKLVIPMDYDEASLKQFTKEAAKENISSMDKLTVKKKDMDSKQGDIIILSHN